MKPEIKAGPFFIINNKLLYHAIPISECEQRSNKLDNPYSHRLLFEKTYGSKYDYIDYPRGRVVWDMSSQRSIIYIDPCINNEETLLKIKSTYNLNDYAVEEDTHYHCKKCSDKIWNDC